MNGKKAMFTMPEIIFSAIMFIIAVLLAPFLFNLLSVSELTGVEGFFARIIPFFVLWYSLIAGSRKFGVGA